MFALRGLMISKGKADLGSNMVTCSELRELGRVVELFLWNAVLTSTLTGWLCGLNDSSLGGEVGAPQQHTEQVHCRAGITNPQNKGRKGFFGGFSYVIFSLFGCFVLTRPTDSLKECVSLLFSLVALSVSCWWCSPWLQDHCELVVPGSGICFGPPSRDWLWGLSSVGVGSLRWLLWCLQPVSECISVQEKFFPGLN